MSLSIVNPLAYPLAMVNFQNKSLLLLLALLCSAPAWAGGGWTPKKGNSYLKLSQYSILAQHYYTPAGDRVPIVTTGVYISSAYWEYGFTDRLALVAYAPLFVRSTLNRTVRPDGSLIAEGDMLNGIGDPEIRLKYQWIDQNGWALATSIGVGLPLGNPSGGETQLLQSGDGELNQLLVVEGSRSFLGGKGYATAMVGINNRTRGFSEELRYGIEAGYRLGPVWLTGRLAGLESFKNGDDELTVNNGIFSNNLEYLVFTPSVAWQAGKRWGITADTGIALRGERILADPSYSVGVYFEF